MDYFSRARWLVGVFFSAGQDDGCLLKCPKFEGQVAMGLALAGEHRERREGSTFPGNSVGSCGGGKAVKALCITLPR